MDRSGPEQHVLLGRRMPTPSPVWETDLDADTLFYLRDHRVGGIAVYPGAGYVGMVLAAQREVSPQAWGVVEDLEFRKFLAIGTDERHTLRVELADRTGNLEVYSRRPDDPTEWVLHATARLSKAVPRREVPPLDFEGVRGRCRDSIDADVFYQELAARGLQYGPCFRTIRGIWRSSEEVLAEITAHPSLIGNTDPSQRHPTLLATLLDAAFQSLAGVRFQQAPDALYVPMKIDRIVVRAGLLTGLSGRLWSHCRVTRMFGRAVEADLTLCDDDGCVLAEIRGLRCQPLPRRAIPGKPERAWQRSEAVPSGPGPSADPVLMPTTVPFILSMAQRGPLNSLRFHETERRPPQASEVELRINAVSLNFKDVLKMKGRLSDAVLEDTFFGAEIGMEAAATVLRVGAGVDAALQAGADIIVMVKGGCLRSYVTVPANDLFWMPGFPEYGELAQVGIPVIFATALYTLHEVARLKAGERVLLHSAAGGVGLAAIQVARWLGAEIFATAGSAEKRDYLRSLGIPHVMDSRSLDFAEEIMAATGGEGVDVVLNLLSGEALEKSVSVLAPFGRLIEIGKRDIEENNGLPLRAFHRNLTFSAIDMDRLAAARPETLRHLLHEIRDGIADGRFRPVPVQAFPIGELAEACRYMLKAKHIGKVVLKMQDERVPVVPLRRAASLGSTS